MNDLQIYIYMGGEKGAARKGTIPPHIGANSGPGRYPLPRKAGLHSTGGREDHGDLAA